MQINLPTKISEETSEELSDYPEIIRQLLVSREINSKDQAEGFFNPKKEFGDPFLFHGMDTAVEAILSAIKEKKKIFIHGDYDVDGVCATSLLFDYLYRELKANVLPYIPSRFDEGYGMTDTSIGQIISEGGELVITVDCGVKDIELIKKYKKTNPELKFIVTDHHTMLQDEKGKDIVSEDAIAVIHPNHPKSKYPFKEICGSAVAWKLVCAISEKLNKSILRDDRYLELVALATVCDVMPLVEENRTIVKFGLEKLKNTEIVGLKILMLDAGILPEKLEAYHLGFVIGPRINAAGRLEHAMDALRLFTTQDPAKAKEYSDNLSALNAKRQDMTKELIEKAEEQIENIGKDKKLYFVWGEDWPEGIVGLVAGKLTEKYNRPVLIASKTAKEVKGSARSVSALNIIEIITENEKILERFGGHSQAAGFTLKHENLETFIKNLQERAEEILKDGDVIQSVSADAKVKIAEMSYQVCEWIEKFKPFGYGNVTPSFIIEKVKVLDRKEVGNDGAHMRLNLEQDGKRIYGIGFYLSEKFKNVSIGDEITLHVNFDLDEWNGERKVQMKIKNLIE